MKTEAEIPQYIEHLIVDYLMDDIGKEDMEELKKWLDRSDINKDLFQKMKASWLISNKSLGQKIFTSENKWNILKRKIKDQRQSDQEKSEKNIRLLPLLRIASVAVIFIALGAGLTYLIMSDNVVIKNKQTEIIVPLGSRSFIKLPDGSKVWLNAGSSLKYKDNFDNSNKREVKLLGEGFFNVKTNAKRPFVVKANNLDIMAYGTAFNVKAYPQEKKVETTLVEGVVNIKGRDYKRKDFTLSMKPNQKITYYTNERLFKSDKLSRNAKNIDQKNQKVEPLALNNIKAPIMMDVNVKTELYTSWKDKRWIIMGERLDQLAVLLERRYNVTINIKSPELNGYLFSGTLENETLEQVFQILRLTIPISYTIKKGNVDVYFDPELKKKYESAY